MQWLAQYIPPPPSLHTSHHTFCCNVQLLQTYHTLELNVSTCKEKHTIINLKVLAMYTEHKHNNMIMEMWSLDSHAYSNARLTGLITEHMPLPHSTVLVDIKSIAHPEKVHV